MEAALKGRAAELEKEYGFLRREVREKRELLEEYRNGGGVEGMAREYAGILAEVERVREEVERLENGG